MTDLPHLRTLDKLDGWSLIVCSQLYMSNIMYELKA